jgi:Spy/CpxP family protein refolding chaperone
MRRLAQLVLALAALALLAGPALAQRGRGMFGGGSPAMLLTQKSVQEELKLTPEQVKKVEAFAAKQRETFQGLRDLDQDARREKMQQLAKEGEQTVKDTLNADQQKRLRQISLQQQGAFALANPQIAKKLGLSDDQQAKIKDVMADAQEKMRDAFQGGFNDETRKKMQEIRKETNTKALAVLTDEQKAKWKAMTGKRFTGEIRFGPPRQRQ